MNNDFFHIMTPFDQALSNTSLQMLKLLIPYLPPQTQRIMAVYIKFLELQTTLSFFRTFRQKDLAPEHIFEDLKPYLPRSALESFDSMMNMVNMMNLFQEMQGASGSNSGSDFNFDFGFDPMSMMKDMLSPEHQDMFQMYQGMFAQENDTEQQKEGDSHD